MKKFVLKCLLIFLALLVPCTYLIRVAISQEEKSILISEVHVNPIGTDTGLEYVELINISDHEVHIGGWDLDAADLPYYTFPTETYIPAKSTYVVYLRKEGIGSVSEEYTGSTFGSTNMKNSAGSIALFSSKTHGLDQLVDFFEYGQKGQTHETLALQKNLWKDEDPLIPSMEEGFSFSRACVESGVICWREEIPSIHASPLLAVMEENVNQNVLPPLPTSEHQLAHARFEEGTYHTVIGDELKITSSSGSTLSVTENGVIQTGLGSYYQKVFLDPGVYNVTYAAESDSIREEAHAITIVVEELGTEEKEPLLYFSEVSWNKEDYIEIRSNATSEDPQDINLKEYSLRIDTFIIPLEGILTHNSPFILAFGVIPQGLPQNTPYMLLSNPSSLVGTTEQVSLYYKETFVDGICWETSPIASTEIQEHEVFTTKTPWQGPCIDAKKASPNRVLIRNEVQDFLSHEQWDIYPVGTPGGENTVAHTLPLAHITVQGTGEYTGIAPFKINLTGENSYDEYEISSYEWTFGDGQTFAGDNPPEHLYALPGAYTVQLKVTNIFGESAYATLSVTVEESMTSSGGVAPMGNTLSAPCTPHEAESELRISEIFPNPKGSDTGKEWVEIFNPTSQEITLCNLMLDDREGGTAPFSLIGQRISPQGYLVVPSELSKISLQNTEGEVRLLSGGEVQERIQYTNAPEDKSYTHFF